MHCRNYINGVPCFRCELHHSSYNVEEKKKPKSVEETVELTQMSCGTVQPPNSSLQRTILWARIHHVFQLVQAKLEGHLHYKPKLSIDQHIYLLKSDLLVPLQQGNTNFNTSFSELFLNLTVTFVLCRWTRLWLPLETVEFFEKKFPPSKWKK